MNIKNAQKVVKDFAEKNSWKDEPNIDKFDHIHEELLEMSRHLRYKEADERRKTVNENREIFEDGIGDLLFAVLRLSNQLGVDAEKAFEEASRKIIEKYDGKKEQKEW